MIFGIDCSVLRGNLHQTEEFCTAVAPRFPRMRFLNFAAAVPSGLASRPGFSEAELLTNEELRTLTGQEHAERLRSLAPASVAVSTSSNLILLMHPDHIERFGFSLMQVEPDGEVRAMPVYEGCVGNLLTDDPAVLWRRATERWRDPFVVEAVSRVRSLADWARRSGASTADSAPVRCLRGSAAARPGPLRGSPEPPRSVGARVRVDVDTATPQRAGSRRRTRQG